MNKPKAITKAVPTASSDDPLAPRDEMSISIDMAKLREMDMRQLAAVRDVLHNVGDVLTAFNCQPRFFNREDHTYTHGGDIIESIIDWFSDYEQAVMNVATDAEPIEADDIETRGWLLIGFEADAQCCLSDMACVATSAARDEAQARRRNALQARKEGRAA